MNIDLQYSRNLRGTKCVTLSDNGTLSPDDQQALQTIISIWPGLSPESILSGHGFGIGLLMAVIAGFTSAGISLCFIYVQAPIKEAVLAQGVDTMTADVAVWAAALLSGAAINIIYPTWIMIKKKNWNVLLGNPQEDVLATVIGLQFILAMTLMGRGMLYLGVFGASVGFAIQQIWETRPSDFFPENQKIHWNR